jgi:GDPmannose 4,6-dehydratase
MKSALITGINGQDGSHLAELLEERGYRVLGLVRPREGERPRSPGTALAGAEILYADLRDEETLRTILKKHAPHEIYNLAARASSSQLFDQPLLTADVNGLAVVRLLEAIRTVDPTIRFCQASSSEMFGHALESPQSEATPFRPRNPYGVAKLFAHGMVGMYRAHYGLFACSAILFNHESARRGPEFVTRRITKAVALIKAGLANSLQLGNLDATRDWGFAGDYVHAMWQMLQAPSAADYVVATGETHSVREFCEIAFGRVGLDYRKFVHTEPNSKYLSESVSLVGDATKAKSELRWSPSVTFRQLVHSMVDADIDLLAHGGASKFEESER